jgi:hypothetical protein
VNKAVEMEVGVTIFILSFISTGSGFKKLKEVINRHTHADRKVIS